MDDLNTLPKRGRIIFLFHLEGAEEESSGFTPQPQWGRRSLTLPESSWSPSERGREREGERERERERLAPGEREREGGRESEVRTRPAVCLSVTAYSKQWEVFPGL
ncbi:unnamed protein product [Gadus morhua 'NCC']